MATVGFTTPDIADQHPDARALVLDWRDYGGRTVFHGAVVTIKCFEDNSLVKALVQEPGRGRVIVVDGGGSLRRALLGDQLAAQAAASGWSGLVLAGAVRDVEILESIDLGVKALGCCPQKTAKRGEGQRDVPIDIGGCLVRSGDFVYADRNGVLLSQRALL